jgi:uncharacterized protein YbjQ (UPF0145 family)
MSNTGGKRNSDEDDDDDRKDLTRIEDLSEFLHQEDPDLESKFGDFNRPEPSSTGINLDSLDDNFNDSTPEFGEPPAIPGISDEHQVPPEIPLDNSSEEIATEDSFGESVFSDEQSTFENTTFEESTFEGEIASENLEAETPSWELPTEDETVSFDEASELETFEPILEEESLQDEEVEEETQPLISIPEKFEDVKSFAQHFSYGKSTGGGNPPFSLIARHIKYKDDADDILILLREFGLVTKTNEAETIKALELGTLLVPQISEYTAIVLAHKLRRYDLDLEVGLSDEIHPSKSGETNPRGLVKKESLKQNKSESMKLKDSPHQFKDVLVTTASKVEGYFVQKHLGVQTTFAIVEEEDLEKLAFISKQEREPNEVFEVSEEFGDLSSESAFRNFKETYVALYEDLTNQLKQKAFTKKANALIGLHFQMNPLQYDRREQRVNAYQVTCSATLAIIAPENK